MLFSTLVLAALSALSNAQSTFSPLRPPAIPLAVRSPYLSTWQQAGSDGGNGGYLAGEWPTFWQGQVTGWQGFIRVDGQTYTWMGASNQISVFANQTAFEYTSTRSVFTLDVAGLVEMVVTFLSPVTPDDLLRSSLPYSYMNVEVASLDGKTHDVQLYSDISAEWVSGDLSANAQWKYGVVRGNPQPQVKQEAPLAHVATVGTQSTTFGTKTAYTLETLVEHPFTPVTASSQGFHPTAISQLEYSNSAKETVSPTANAKRAPDANRATGGVAYHRVWRQQQLEFSEINQQANWGYWYYSTKNVNGLTYQSGADVDVRARFINNGSLADTQDTDFRAIDDRYPVFGFAKDLGKVGSSSVSTLFQISLHQESCIQFESGYKVVQPVSCMWTSYFSNEKSAVAFFYNDFAEASSITSQFDNQVKTDSIAVGGQNYASITSLAVRQAFGALEFTNSPTEPWVFLKEISSDGNIQTVDVIFPFHPIAIYANATILKYMLDPLFINQEAGNWPYQFSIHDIGSAFPNATGHNDGSDEMQPLEECGDMIIMTLAYAQRANDDAYLAKHYQILKQWNNYLVNDSLIPANQISTDDFAGSLANQTNLAIKGIIGIEAMAQIANRTGHVHDGKNFTQIAHNYTNLWMQYGIAQTSDNFTLPHTTLAYGENDTYSLLYNLFGDKELGLELVPQSVYSMQSKFYPQVFEKYGVPLDTRHVYTKGKVRKGHSAC